MDDQDKTADLPQNNSNPSGQVPATGGVVPQNPNPSDQPDKLVNTEEFTEIAMPSGAEDTDLIEKEWVERAKQIVEHTREDPYEQQRALSQMKADYLKKRYNKDIKVSDD